MLATTQWPLERAANLTSLVWVCVLWLPESLMGLSALWALIIGIRGWIDIKGCEPIGCWTQVLTLNLYPTDDLDFDFQGQMFNSHIFGMGRSIDLEWKRCELDTMLDAQWASSWPTVHGKYISFQPFGPWMGYSFTDLGAEVWCRSLNALLLLNTMSRTE